MVRNKGVNSAHPLNAFRLDLDPVPESLIGNYVEIIWEGVVLGVEKHERQTREFCHLSLFLLFSFLFLSSFSPVFLHQAFSYEK